MSRPAHRRGAAAGSARTRSLPLHANPLIPLHDAELLLEARHHDPFSVLGPHRGGAGWIVRAFLPGAREAALILADGQAVEMRSAGAAGLFAAETETTLQDPGAYRLRIAWPGGVQETADPYAHGLLISDYDLHLFREGTHRELARVFGAQPVNLGGVEGVRFSVWAPNAQRVSVVGDFNAWDCRRHPMRVRHDAGVWELFIPQAAPGARYKFDILGRDGRRHLKADPLGRAAEGHGKSASVIAGALEHAWTDAAWIERRGALQSADSPMSIYEVHAGSWKRHVYDRSRPYHWDDLVEHLVPYVQRMGFTHVELLPVTAHPFRGSWGYQPVGLFAPDPEMGDAEGLARFVDACHAANIGVILDWVPAHFPSDPHGLAHFDGTALYEHADPREGHHKDWDTLIYNYGRAEVREFLIASALHWLEAFHIDGLRVDAVASMLYRDYSRKPGEWVPNRYGGRENLEAVSFLRELNRVVHERCPQTLVIAEESTAWPKVTGDEKHDGLGFSYKWNMGWMHDTLHFMQRDAVHRRHHADQLTFGLVYAFSERFILPLSHDEVVHGKGTLLDRMPGDRWQQFANLRAYFGFMWAHPGKKLLFMGGEFAQTLEWNHDAQLEWGLLGEPGHAGVQALVQDLNQRYRELPALWQQDAAPAGFEWLIADDRSNTVFAFLRHAAQGQPLLCVCNFTPVPRQGYRVGVPLAGAWKLLLDTDSSRYAGSGYARAIDSCTAEQHAAHGKPWSLLLDLPPLATLYLAPAAH